MRKKKDNTKVAGIYRITCLTTGCVYIGSTMSINKRLRTYSTKANKCNSKLIRESINKNGIENHEFKVMCEFDANIPKKELADYEDAFILLYLNRLGEDYILNFYTNTKSWCRKGYQKNMIDKNKSIPIYQYDLNNNLIKKWDSSKQIQRVLNIKQSNIISCCGGRRKTSGGFIWKRELL